MSEKLRGSGASRGVMYVHSAPAALCPHIEWAVAGVLGARQSFTWTPQPLAPGAYRTELPWRGDPGTASRITSALRRWQLIRFEVTEDAPVTGTGMRFSCTPDLGVFAATTNAHGDVMVDENRLRAARQAAISGQRRLEESLDLLLGRPWDEELDVFRHAGEDAPGTRLFLVG